MDLVKLITDQLSGDALNSLSSVLGTDNKTTRDAASAAVPAILTGLAGMGSTDDGARRLASTIDNLDTNFSGGVGALGNLASLFDGGDANAVQQKGGSILSSLFGENLVSNIATSVGRYAGLEPATTKKLLTWLMPLVLGLIGSKWKNQGGSIGGLASLLTDQKQNIAKAAPAGFNLGSIPGLPSIDQGLRVAGQTARAAGDTAAEAARRTGKAAGDASQSLLTWVWPIAGLALVLLALWFIFGRGQGPGAAANKAANQAANAAATATQAAADTAKAAANTAQRAASATGEAARSTAEKITALRPQLPDVPDLTLMSKDVTGIFDSATQSLGTIKDAASAEAALPELTQLNSKIDGIRDQLDNLPAAAQATLGTTIGKQFGALQAQVDKVLAMPDISDELRTALLSITSKLRGLNLAQVSKDTTGLFASLTKTLEGFKDAQAAEEGLPQLQDLSNKLAGLSRVQASMSPGGKSMLAKLIAAARGPLDQLITKVVTQLGADAATVKPVLDKIVNQVAALAEPAEKSL